MDAPEDIVLWASGAGSTVLAGPLAIDEISWVSGALIDVFFAAATDLTGTQPGHMLVVESATEAVNNGRFPIVEADPANDRLRIKNTARISSTTTYDEAASPGTGSVENGGPVLIEIPEEKQELGYFDDEYPSAGQMNKILGNVTAWNKYLALGGALVFKSDIASWQTETRTQPGGEGIVAAGLYRFDPAATDTPGEGVLQQDSGSGRGLLEFPHVNHIWTVLALMLPEFVPPVTATLDFASVSANSVGTPLTVTVPGAKAGDLVSLGAPAGLETGMTAFGLVTADNTVSIRPVNGTGGAINPAAASWTVQVQKNNMLPSPSVRGLKLFANLLGGTYANSAALQTDLGIADNEAGFRQLLNWTWARKQLLADSTAKTRIQGSVLANAAMEDYEGVGY